MNRLVAVIFLALVMGVPADLIGQEAAKPSAAPSAATKKEAKKSATAKAEPGGSPKAKGNDLNAGVTGPILTEIYADEAFFDSNKSVGIFRGHVKVNDPRFNLQSDKLTAFISKAQTRQTAQAGPTAEASQTPQATASGASGATGASGQTGQSGQGQGLEKAIAEGNVAVVRDRPDPNGGPPTHAVGLAETATYVAATGDVELKGNPRVQQGMNTHVATSPETVMVINQSGQLTTHGPSRTEIRQEPKDENSPAEKSDKKSADKDEKKPGAKDEKKSPPPKS
jgi:lipopolysaccharide export system protein LptA